MVKALEISEPWGHCPRVPEPGDGEPRAEAQGGSSSSSPEDTADRRLSPSPPAINCQLVRGFLGFLRLL